MEGKRKACFDCASRHLAINGYDDFVNECTANNDRKIDVNVFDATPDWCPLNKVTYTDNGDGTFTETTKEEQNNGGV